MLYTHIFNYVTESLCPCMLVSIYFWWLLHTGNRFFDYVAHEYWFYYPCWLFLEHGCWCWYYQCQVGNFRVEPPGLFRGRGDHPKVLPTFFRKQSRFRSCCWSYIVCYVAASAETCTSSYCLLKINDFFICRLLYLPDGEAEKTHMSKWHHNKYWKGRPNSRMSYPWWKVFFLMIFLRLKGKG